MIVLDPPHITGSSPAEQLQQLIGFQRKLVEQLNVELNRELDDLKQKEESEIVKN